MARDHLRLIVLLGVLAAWNVLVNLVVPSPAYIPANLLAGAGLLALAARWGFGLDDIGLERTRARTGVRWGLAAAVVVAVVFSALVAWPWTRRFFEDGTLVDISVAGLLYQVAFRIPIGTALFEELAFRGVLLAVWSAESTRRPAVLGSSIAFGFWHVIPTLERLDLNPAGGYAVNGFAEVGLVAGAVASTFVAGLIFVWLRARSRSLIAPIVAHAAINSTAFLLGWVIAN